MFLHLHGSYLALILQIRVFNLKYLWTLGNCKRATEVKRKGRSSRRGVEHGQHGKEGENGEGLSGERDRRKTNIKNVWKSHTETYCIKHTHTTLKSLTGATLQSR